MQKQRIFFAMLIPLFLLAACARAPQPTETPTPAPTVEPSPTVTAVQLTPTSEPTAIPTPSTDLITVNNAWGLNILRSLELPVDPSTIVWSQDGSALAVTAYKDVVLVNVADMKIIKQVTLPENETLVDFSSDGHSLATTTNDFKTITITDILSGQVIQTIDPGVQFVTASFSPDGSQLVVGSVDNWTGLIFNVSSGKQVATITGFQTAAPVYTVRFGADEKSLVWVARGTIQVEQIASQALGAYIGHEDFITAWSLTHSGSLLITAAGGTLNGAFSPLLNYWNPTTGAEIAKLVLPDSAYNLAFSPDDTLLAGTAGDNVIIWDVVSQVQIFIDPAHLGGARDARFSPSGGLLATIGADRLLNIWSTK